MRPPRTTPLGRLIAETIAAEGPMRLDRYMELCVGHPGHGYYASRDPFGRGGDFTTSPEISQMFGELIGLWCAEVWSRMGRPPRVALVELGPGRGTMMADMLRAARAAPDFLAAIEATLVETSPTLAEIQAETLDRAGVGVMRRWARSVGEALRPGADDRDAPDAGADLHLSPAGRGRPEGPGEGDQPSPENPAPPHPPGFAGRPLPTGERWAAEPSPNATPPLPAIVVANEFFDALPIRQFVRADRGWRERLIGLDEGGALAFGLAPDAPTDVALPDAPQGSIREVCAPALQIAADIAAHLSAYGGAMLAIDYGYASGAGDTFQAMADHAYADPLAEPGEADLTAHVDFSALAAAASRGGAAAMGLLTQADMLDRFGLLARAKRLGMRASPSNRAAIEDAVARLTDRSPRGMGALFKALAFGDPRLGPLPGFEPATGA